MRAQGRGDRSSAPTRLSLWPLYSYVEGESMRIILGLAAAAALALPAPVLSQAVQTSPSAKALFLAAIDQDKLATPAGRDALVQATQAYCDEVGRSYPRNSPAEEEWL